MRSAEDVSISWHLDNDIDNVDNRTKTLPVVKPTRTLGLGKNVVVCFHFFMAIFLLKGHFAVSHFSNFVWNVGKRRNI